jgi:hypothetical protein
MKIIKFKTIGSDPEFAIRKDNINLPSYMFIDSKKGSPKEYESGFGIMKDNLLMFSRQAQKYTQTFESSLLFPDLTNHQLIKPKIEAA